MEKQQMTGQLDEAWFRFMPQQSSREVLHQCWNSSSGIWMGGFDLGLANIISIASYRRHRIVRIHIRLKLLCLRWAQVRCV